MNCWEAASRWERDPPPHTHTQTMNIYACILSTHGILSAITHRHSLRDYPPSYTPTLRGTGAHRHWQHTLEETSLLVTGRHAIYTRRTTTLETSSLEYRAKTHTHTNTQLTSDAPCLSPLSDGHKEPSYKQEWKIHRCNILNYLSFKIAV